jgi:acetyltransferase-like isoleucine patch superfamily enzyme
MIRDPIVSKNIRLRRPDLLTIGEGSIIDDYCYFSTRVTIGRFSHIASGCSIAGGSDRLFALGDFSSLSSGVKVWCTSDNYAKDLVTIIPPEFGPIKQHLISADVIFGSMTAVGANSVIMPGNHVPDGTVIGALSFVPADFKFDAWSVYAGIPIRKVDRRDRDAVLRQAEVFERKLREERGQ